jgi:integrase
MGDHDMKTPDGLKIERLIASNKVPRTRIQKGTICERSGQLYLRYYQNDKKTCEFLHAVDADHYIARTRKGQQLSPAVDALRAQRMIAVNSAVMPAEKMLISDFVENRYWKWAEEEPLAQSTITGYKKIYSAHLEAEFAGKTLAQYSTDDAETFLKGLKKKLGRIALAHVRNCASGIFRVAKVKPNPWREINQPKTDAPWEGHAYTETESDAILNAITRTDGKLLFALCAYMGLRPSEAAGLTWEKVGDEYIKIRSAVVSGIPTGKLKTDRTKRDLWIVDQVKPLLIEWRAQCGGVTAGLVFTGRNGRPLNSSSFAKHCIIDDVQAAGLTWYGLYAGRHGVGTRVTEHEGIDAAVSVLGNSYQVCADKYVKVQQARSDAGLRSISKSINRGNHAAA